MDLIPRSEFLSCGYCFCDKSYDLNLSAIHETKNKEPYFPQQNIPFTLSLIDAANGNVVVVRFFFSISHWCVNEDLCM